MIGLTFDCDWSWKETPGAQRPIKDLRGSHYSVEGIKYLKLEVVKCCQYRSSW